jgi:microcystin-dependent protein
MSEPFIAEIRIFAGNFAPRNWAFCNGQLLPIAQNTALFSLVGTIYGGDGRTTLGLPNLQGRAAMHWGSGPGLTTRRIGESGGSEFETLSLAQIPSHDHALVGSQEDDDSTLPGGNYYGGLSAAYVSPAAGTLGAMASESLPIAGGGQAHTNRQPFLTVNFIIALLGVYPSRS